MKKKMIYIRMLWLVFLLPSLLCFHVLAATECIDKQAYTVVEIIQVDNPRIEDGWMYKKINLKLDFAPCFEGIDILTEGNSDPEWYFEGIRAHFLVSYKNVFYMLIMRVTKNTFGLWKVKNINKLGEIEDPLEKVRDFESERLYVSLEAMILKKEEDTKAKPKHIKHNKTR